MGREARCICRWGERSGNVRAFLESSELVMRGDIRARAPLHALEQVSARGDNLEFVIDGERVSLALGAVFAHRWAAVIAAPPPTLAHKLGITAITRLHTSGAIDDDALRAALVGAAEAASSVEAADLAIVRTDDEVVLEGWATAAAAGAYEPPVWIVYVKGRTAPLGERRAREVMRRYGFVDTKVAAVSERLTALRFTKTR